MVVRPISMILNCKRPIVELLVMSQDGLSSANVLKDMLDNSVSPVPQDIDIVRLTEVHLCLAFLAIVISMLKYAILKLEGVFASTILEETIVINVQGELKYIFYFRESY